VFDDVARQVLQQPLIARLATIGTDGYPHNIPLWFLLDGDDIVIISDRANRKTRNLQATPKATLTVGGDALHGAGYMVKADVTIEEDVGHVVTERITRHYETEADANRLLKEWENDDIVILRLKPVSVIKVY
jgi:PPOX class probable F420-dependent enzyme